MSNDDLQSVKTIPSDISEPLIQTDFNKKPKVINNNKPSTISEKPNSSKNVFSIDHAHSFDSDRGKYIYPPLLNVEGDNPSMEISTHSSNNHGRDNGYQPRNELAAMSVLSLLDNTKFLDAEMDTNT